MSSLRLQIMTVTIFTTKKDVSKPKLPVSEFVKSSIIRQKVYEDDSKHYCYGQTDYDANGGIGGRYFHTGAGEPTLDPTIQTYMTYQSSEPIPMSVLNMVLGLDPSGQYRSFNYNPFMSYDPSAGLIAAKWEWECTFSAFNFQRLLNGRPASGLS